LGVSAGAPDKPKPTPTPTPEIISQQPAAKEIPNCSDLLQAKHKSWVVVKRASDGRVAWINLCMVAEYVESPAEAPEGK